MAIIGSHGMLGSDLVRYLGAKFRVTPIHKENYRTHVGSSFDIVINANGNSKRFWANSHPYEDFIASTASVYKSIFDFTYDVYVYMSSSDVYNNHTRPRYTTEDTPSRPDTLSAYGLHKYLSEIIIRKHVKKYLILRSSMILGSNLKKGSLYDAMHHEPLFITRDSRLQMITTKSIADIVCTLIDKKISNGVFNMGGMGAFPFSGLDRYVPGPHIYRTDAEKQLYEMNVAKMLKLYPLKTSEEYLQEFLHEL